MEFSQQIKQEALFPAPASATSCSGNFFPLRPLEEAWNAVEQQIKGLMLTRPMDWLSTSPGATKTLGKAEMQLWAQQPITPKLLRHARITGSSSSREAGLKALGFIGQFNVPRGARSGVSTIPTGYPPAAYTIGACVDAWRLTEILIISIML